MSLRHYILGGEDGHTPVAVDWWEWACWFEIPGARRVAQTQLDDVWISTVFLGLDHNWSGIGEPILFETMIFDADDPGGECWRYSTWDEAVRGHAVTCDLVGAALATRP